MGKKIKHKKTEINVIIKIKTPQIEPEHSEQRDTEQRHYYL